jgi:hypothetical protein
MGRMTKIDKLLMRYPYFPLILILIFFIFYFGIIRRTHKGFEELMERGPITAFSYLAAFGVFATLFILYLRISPTNRLSQFPLFGTVFFGYFSILVTEVYSTTTLRIKEYREKKDIVDALNHVAGHFFRTDILEEMWGKVIDKYADLDPELEKARFYPPERTFDLDMVNEKAKASAAVAMLHMLDEVRREKNAPVVPFDDDIKNDIETLLNEKILLLPAELSKGFKEEIYYPKLLENTFNRINKALTPFVSFEDYENILKKLINIDVFFNNLTFEKNEVKIKEGLELSRKEFLKYLKLYIQGLENIFPFNRLLLRDTVRSEVQDRLNFYGFTQADVLNNDVLLMFISKGLKEGEAGVFATSRIPSGDLLRTLKSIGKESSKLKIIDLYLSTHTDNVVKIGVTKGECQIISTSLIDVKQAVVSSVKNYPKESHKRIVLDIYSDLAKYQNLKEILDLIVKQVDGFKRWNVTSIITLSPNLSSEELERHFDNIFLLTDVSTIKIKKLFGGKPKKDSFIIWGTYSPVEEPDHSLFFDSR